MVIYHISGCGVCDECQHGYMISCHSDSRAAYGWQRDGGHAPTCWPRRTPASRLPDSLSFIDGALCLRLRHGVRGAAADAGQRPGPPADHRSGAGRTGRGHARPCARAPADPRHRPLGSGWRWRATWDWSTQPSRPTTALGQILDRTGGHGCEASIDCSGPHGASLASQGTRDWGRCAFVGEGGTVSFEVSKYLIHKQITLFGSWVTSLLHMEELVERLDRWGLHPALIVTDTFTLDDAAAAYRLADQGTAGKVVITFP